LKVLVIGGSGYIGSHAVYELIRDGHEVVIIDNLSTGIKGFAHPKAKFVWGDIRRKSDILNTIKEEAKTTKPIDVVMHFAAKLIVPESVTQPLSYYENNVEGVRVMLEAMVDGGVENLVFSSTAATYGDSGKDVCEEDDFCIPINPYGETKLASEKLIKWAAAAQDLNYCILRYFNVAGADASLKIGLKKDQLTHLVPLIMQAALGKRDKLSIFGDDYSTPDGTCIRDYIHVTDLAKAHVLGAKHIVKGNASLLANLGSGVGYSVKEVVEAALEIFNFKYEYAPRRPGDPAKLIASNKRAKETLGWQPELGLKEILQSDYDFRKKFL
jgi:UDP-glucose 4-epimerase